MPRPFFPVKKVYKDQGIHNNTRNPKSIVDTEPLNAVAHRKKNFSSPVVTNVVSSEPHVERMDKQ